MPQRQQLTQPRSQRGLRRKIEDIVPINVIPGTANWVSDGFMDGVTLPVGTVS